MSAIVYISERALCTCVNRALAKQNQELRPAKPGPRAHQDVDGYIIVDRAMNAILDKDLDMEALSKK